MKVLTILDRVILASDLTMSLLSMWFFKALVKRRIRSEFVPVVGDLGVAAGFY